MSRYRSDPDMLETTPSTCTSFLRYTWKTITCLFSHVTLVSMVVSYCILGAFTFAKLEVDHEKEVKKNISTIRGNVTDELWKLATVKTEVLEEGNFTKEVIIRLQDFERSLLKAMTKDGWNGEEDIENVQWTITGALFYSIIVITTIGYGHITPKTTWGKIVTIFYAILGIPLMLLCLSNIGDIMATSFRFLYWRVCCYMCTKKPKKQKRKSVRGNMRSPEARFANRNRQSFRRSVRTSTRSADSGFGFSENVPSSHSDTELRYHDGTELNEFTSLPHTRTSQRSGYSDTSMPPSRRVNSSPRRQLYTGSLDRRTNSRDVEIAIDPHLLAKTPILCNKYVVDMGDAVGNHVQAAPNRDNGRRLSPMTGRRAISMPRNQAYLAPPRERSLSSVDGEDELGGSVRKKRPSPRRSPAPQVAPKMMTPLGYGPRHKYVDDPESDNEFYDDGFYEPGRTPIKNVPIWLCVFLVVSYITAGAYLFHRWEGWDFLDSAYFCFITLTTIGFGDLVPAKGVRWDDQSATVSIALCSLYLLFGIALLAMSFNLVQEEVIAIVKSVAKALGIIKSEENDSDED